MAVYAVTDGGDGFNEAGAKCPGEHCMAVGNSASAN